MESKAGRGRRHESYTISDNIQGPCLKVVYECMVGNVAMVDSNSHFQMGSDISIQIIIENEARSMKIVILAKLLRWM